MSGYLARTSLAMSAIGLMMPVEVSFMVRQRVSKPPFGQLGVHELRGDRLAGLDLDRLSRQAVGLGDLEPTPGELAVDGVQHLLSDAVADDAFHDAGGG